MLGVPVRGDAKNLPNNSVPKAGNILLLYYGTSFHAAYIDKVLPEGYLVKEANYKKCEETSRIVSVRDKYIWGFYDWRIPKIVE